MKGRILGAVLFGLAVSVPNAVLIYTLQKDAEKPVFSAQYSCMEPAKLHDVGRMDVWSFDTSPEGQALFYVSPLQQGEFSLLRAVPFKNMGEVTVMGNGDMILETEDLRVGVKDPYPGGPSLEQPGGN